LDVTPQAVWSGGLIARSGWRRGTPNIVLPHQVWGSRGSHWID
jgi:hypothetical protein